jgi:hypothetical protein
VKEFWVLSPEFAVWVTVAVPWVPEAEPVLWAAFALSETAVPVGTMLFTPKGSGLTEGISALADGAAL